MQIFNKHMDTDLSSCQSIKKGVMVIFEDERLHFTKSYLFNRSNLARAFNLTRRIQFQDGIYLRIVNPIVEESKG